MNTIKFLAVFFSVIGTVIAGPDDSPKPICPIPTVAMGDPNAPIKVVMYHALNCPHCKEFKEKLFPEFRQKFIDTGIVHFEMRDFPIDFVSIAASKLAWCKEKTPESYHKYSHIIMDNLRTEEGQKVDVDWYNSETANQAIERLADLLSHHGLTMDECKECLKDKSPIEEYILEDCMAVQTKYKLDHAPGFIVNGDLVELPDLEKEILKRHKELLNPQPQFRSKL